MAKRNSKPTNTWAQRTGNQTAPIAPSRSTSPSESSTDSEWRPPVRDRRISLMFVRDALGNRVNARVIGGIAAAAAIIVAVVVIAVFTMQGEPDPTARADIVITDIANPMAAQSDSALPCEEISTPQRTQSRGTGDRTGPAQLIIAYENAFFDRRDPAAMVAMTSPGPEVASADALAAGIAAVEPGAAWCVTITPEATPDVYTAAIRFVDGDDGVVRWNQSMTVTLRDPAVPDSWTITSVRALP